VRRIKRHRTRSAEAADLDITPFMNLMIVLVPVLLLSMVFTHTSVIELNFPTGEGASAAFDPDAVHLEIQVKNDELLVADGRGGVIKAVPQKAGEHDYAQLTLVLQELKKRMPEKQDITVLLEEETSYQTLVRVMDRVRSYPAVVGLDVVEAELFPVISLGDTPKAKVSDVAIDNSDARTSALPPVTRLAAQERG